MRSQSLQCRNADSCHQGAVTTRTAAVYAPRIYQLRHGPHNASSSDSSIRAWWCDCRLSALHRQSSCKCRAIVDSSSGSERPVTGTSSSASLGKSSWGSSWGKRSGGSVFKKQGKQEPARQQKTNETPAAQQTAAGDRLDPQLEASIRMNVERANQTLQEIVQEVLSELLVEEASAYVLGQAEADLQLNQAVRNAVVKRLEWLDSNFLAALNAFLSVPGVRGDPQLSELLSAIRQETLQLVSARLPPAVQVLNTAASHRWRADRGSVLQQALAGGAGDVPGTNLDALGAATHQLIDDMEDQQVVADRVLLARLVLIREELRALAEQQSAQQFWELSSSEDSAAAAAAAGPAAAAAAGAGAAGADTSSASSGSSQPFFAFHRSNLPARCAAFLKNLLTVQDVTTRLGLLTKTFQEDWMAEQGKSAAAEAEAAKAPQQPTFSQQRAATRDTNFGPAPSEQQQQEEAPDIVRPGRLLTTLHAMRQELEEQLVASGVDSPAGAEALSLLRRLEDIRVEALVALDRVQRSRPDSSSSSEGRDGLDYEADLQEHAAAVKAAA